MPRISSLSLGHRGLYLLASSLWCVAGIKVLSIGIGAAYDASLWISVVWLVVALAFFSGFVFPRVAVHNIDAIRSSQADTLPFYRCFTPTSWAIKISMITFGITLRYSGLLGADFIAGFYVGLGLSLLLVVRHYIRPIRLGRALAYDRS